MAKYEPNIEQAIHEIAMEHAKIELNEYLPGESDVKIINNVLDTAYNAYILAFKEVSRYAESKEE